MSARRKPIRKGPPVTEKRGATKVQYPSKGKQTKGTGKSTTTKTSKK